MRTFAHVGMPFKRKPLLFGQFSQSFDELITFHGCDDRTKISECQEVRRRAGGTRRRFRAPSCRFYPEGILYILLIMLALVNSGFEFLRVSVSPWWTVFPACRGILATKNPLRQGPERVVKSAYGFQGADDVAGAPVVEIYVVLLKRRFEKVWQPGSKVILRGATVA